MEKYIARYADGCRLLREAIGDLPEAAWRFKPDARTWSVQEVVWHLADAEIVMNHRMKAVLSERNPLLTAFDQDAWADRVHYPSLNVEDAVNLIKLLRVSFVPVLRKLSAEDWKRTGVHNEAGKLTLADLLVSDVEHLDTHIAQIKRILAAYRA